MEYVYAAMLLHKANKKIEEAAVKKVLEAAGVTVDDSRLKALVAALDGVDIEEAIKQAAVTAAPVSSQATTEDKKPEDDKKEESKEDEKKSNEEAAAGLGALFG